MAVMIVLAVLMGVAVPRYINYTSQSNQIAIASSLKTIRDVMLQYRNDHGALPGDTLGSQMPVELLPYLDNNSWQTPLAGIGVYNWDGPAGNGMGGWPGNEAIGIGSLVTVPSNPTADAFWVGVDSRIDDGNLTTGLFRWESGSQRYRLHIDPH
jgi:type II secretory pathway pseudopilin PulG